MTEEVRKEKGTSGFNLRTERSSEVVIVWMKAWGFWDDTMAEEWKKAAFQAFANANASGGKRWCVLVDNTGFLPQRDTVKATISEAMTTAIRMGMARSAIVQGETLTKFQLTRLAKEAGMPGVSFHVNEGEALAALLAGG